MLRRDLIAAPRPFTAATLDQMPRHLSSGLLTMAASGTSLLSLLAKRVALEGLGHLAHEERPDQVAARILAFATRLGASPAG